MVEETPPEQQEPLVQPAAPVSKSRSLKIAGGALALVSAGVLATVLFAPAGGAPRRGVRSLLEKPKPVDETMKGACELPEKFCKLNPGREDKLSYRDCDGDGVLDPYCEGGELLRFGYVSSKNGCKNNWPNGICTREVEPDSNQGEFGDKAASNEITVIHFNDVYQVGGVLEGSVRRGGMSRAAHYVNHERKRNPDRTFVVFAGDALSPSVLSDLFEGQQMVDILNTMKLDAASLGNHEFDFGVDTLEKRLKESEFPWLNVNLMNEKGELLPETTKYFIKEVPWAPRFAPDKKSTVKVCFFGVAYDVRETMFKDVDRITYKDVMDTSKKEVEFLRNTKKCDVVMPLTHQFSKEDCQLSKTLGKGVDLILGGHDHSTELTSVCGHAPYVKAASDLKTQWVMTLWLDDNGKVNSVDGKLLSLTDADPFDVDIHQKVVEWEDKGAAEMGKVIGCSKVDLESKDAQVRQMETNQADFFTDAVRSFHKTDVALVNGGTMRGNKVYEKGKLTKKICTEMHPFGNAVAKIYATGKELKNYINLMLDCYENVCGNFVQVSGLKYEFDPKQPKGKRLQKLMTADGTEIDEQKKFTVAITDYMLANSPMKHNKLYNMVTLNDAVPLVQALFAAVREAGDKCVESKVDGRIKKL